MGVENSSALVEIRARKENIFYLCAGLIPAPYSYLLCAACQPILRASWPKIRIRSKPMLATSRAAA